VIGRRREMKVLGATQPIEFRRGVHGLVAMVAQTMNASPYRRDGFVLRSMMPLHESDLQRVMQCQLA
jgi:transposase